MSLEVFVNKKRVVADIIDLNIDEGWVEIEDLSVLTQAPEEEGKPGDALLTSPISLPRKRLLGKITVQVTKSEN